MVRTQPSDLPFSESFRLQFWLPLSVSAPAPHGQRSLSWRQPALLQEATLSAGGAEDTQIEVEKRLHRCLFSQTRLDQLVPATERIASRSQASNQGFPNSRARMRSIWAVLRT